MEREDRIKKLEVALRGYANRNLILAMENKRLMEENEAKGIWRRGLLRMDEEASMWGFFLI